ncbi:MAG: hypothetical protein WCT49_06060, partial [Candidatus Paceibacterota bacterium]
MLKKIIIDSNVRRFLSIIFPVIFAGIFVPCGSVFADTNITASIASNTTWTTAGGVYIIQNDISVNSGVTLTI